MTGLLAVAAAATIGSHGVSATLPPGWHGRAGHGYLEAATVPLAPERGYIGTSTRARLGRARRARAAVREHGRDRPGRGTQRAAAAVPGARASRRLGGAQLPHRPARLQPVLDERPGRRNQAGGRGEPARREPARPAAATSIRASSRPVRFRAAPGWHTGSTPAAPADAVNQVQSWAATVPWADGPYELPPHRTLARLGPHGVAIAVTAWRDDRAPPARVPAGPPFRIALRAVRELRRRAGSARLHVPRRARAAVRHGRLGRLRPAAPEPGRPRTGAGRARPAHLAGLAALLVAQEAGRLERVVVAPARAGR